ncbi:hypothetical protein AP058_00181 [Flavobacterium sp. TAB 87]|nr:hypothetical protein AP058_00181 [Flavobacterium sp. TAB 87]
MEQQKIKIHQLIIDVYKDLGFPIVVVSVERVKYNL